MLDCHVSAYLIVPGRVFGRKLKHLTLMHYWLLEASGSPYPVGSSVSVSDAVFASLVCSLPPRLVLWLLRQPGLLRLVVRLWSWRARRFNLFAEVAAFGDYWRAYTEMPDPLVDPGEKSGNPSCLPSSMNIAWTIMRRVGEKRAWSMPMPLALAYFACEAERNGRSFVSERMKAMARLNAIAEAEQLASESPNG